MKHLFLIVICIFLSRDVSGTVHAVYPGDCIQVAVDSALEDDTVAIWDGNYAETVVTYGKSLVIGSFMILDGDSSHIPATVVTPDFVRPDTHSCFVYAHGEGSANRLLGLTLRGGTGTYWNLLQGFAGGAVYVCTSRVSIEQCRITNSSAYVGGGVAATRVDDVIRTEISLIGCQIDSCWCVFWGGGLYTNCTRAEIRNSTFLRCETSGGSGGAELIETESTIDSCLITECRGEVGGIHFTGRGQVADCVFENNQSIWPPGECDLSITQFGGEISVFRNRFRQNGSANHAVNLGGTGGYPVNFYGNIVEDHTALEVTGTVMVWDAYGGNVAYNVFRNNVNRRGGTIQVYGFSNVRIHHNVIRSNFMEEPTYGSVLLMVEEGHATLDSNVISQNSGPTIWIEEEIPWNCIVDARNNWWGHSSGPYHPTQNPSGQGDTLLSDSVLFIPWLTEPPDTTMPDDYLSVRERPEISRTWELAALYPNPFNSSSRIVLAGFAGNDFEITLHNLLGQVVDVIHRGPLTGGQLTYQAPPQLASGVYFLRASDHTAVQSRKIILMR